MRRWDSLVDRYVDEYQAAGWSPERVAIIRSELGKFGLWIKARRPRPKLEEINADLMVGYIRERTMFKAKATVSGVMSALRCMGRWLVREGYWASSPLKWLNGPKLNPYARAPRRIDRQSMDRLWQGALASPNEFQRHQRLAMIAILYGLGLRRGELERLSVSHWDREQGLLLVDGRKTGRQRQLTVPELVWHAVESYLPKRHNFLEQLGRTDEPALFVNHLGARLPGERISRGIHLMARRAGVPLTSMHQFRHSCASDLLEAGVRLPEVQQTLGHQGIGTTVRYLHFSDPQRREAANRHPLNDWLKGGVA